MTENICFIQEAINKDLILGGPDGCHFLNLSSSAVKLTRMDKTKGNLLGLNISLQSIEHDAAS